MSRFNELVRDAQTGLGTGPAGQSPDATMLLSRWLDFNLASYSVVTTNGLALLNGLISAAEEALPPRHPASRPSWPASQVEVRLEGRPRDCVTAAFAVENHFDLAVEVAFDSGKLIPSKGKSLPGSLITFEPGELTIAPRGEAVVQVAVTITPAFVIGQTYTTTIRLSGYQTKKIGFLLTILPPTRPPAKQRRRSTQ